MQIHRLIPQILTLLFASIFISDCGYSQGWKMIRVHPEVQWAKLHSLAEGAALASKELFA